MQVVDSDREELTIRLRGLAEAATVLAEQARAANDLLAESERNSLRNLARLASEVSKSDDSELRDNLAVLYPLAQRPHIPDEDVSFSALLLDKRVSDVRDAISAADMSARKLGFPVTQQEVLLPPPITVAASEVKNELADLRSKLTSIDGDVSALKVSGLQIGLVNVSLPKIEIKIDLAKAIVLVTEMIDASGLARLFDGIRRVSQTVVDGLVRGTTGIARSIVDPLKSLIERATSALATSRSMVAKAQDQSDAIFESRGRIWTESEIKSLLLRKAVIPDEAIPFVRTLEFDFHETYDSRQLSKLSSLRSLHIRRLQPDMLPGLSQLKGLRKLEIGYGFPRADFSFLSRFDQLEELSLSNSYQAVMLGVLPAVLSATNLTTLNLRGFDTPALPDLSACQKLSELKVENCRIAGWSALSSATQCERLSLDGSSGWQVGLLKSLHQLTSLDIRNIPLQNLSALRQLPKLDTVFISRRFASRDLVSTIPGRMKVLGDLHGMIRPAR